jgi:archaellin
MFMVHQLGYRLRRPGGPGEQVDMTVTLTNLSPLLPKSREFTIQVKPNQGAVVIVNRTTPPELKAIMELN